MRGLWRRQRGISLLEIMIALSLGAFMLIGIISLVGSVSATRTTLARTSEQIEGGRYALQLFAEDVALAGFYGRYHPGVGTATYTMPDPCADGSTVAALGFVASPVSMPVAIAGFAGGTTLPSCISGESAVANSEVLVIHRVEPNPVAVTGIGASNTTPYLQISGCTTDATNFVFSKVATDLVHSQNDCSTVAEAWPYSVRSYFIADCDDCSGSGDGRPTLKLREYRDGVTTTRSLVDGVVDMHFSYGLDLEDGFGTVPAGSPDGSPDCYVDNPGVTTAPASCSATGWSTVAAENWQNVVAVRVSLLLRGLEPSLASADSKTYDLGRVDGSGDPVRAGPFNDLYKRQVFSSVITIPNVAGPRE